MIIKDIFLDEGVARAIRQEQQQRKCSVAYNDYKALKNNSNLDNSEKEEDNDIMDT